MSFNFGTTTTNMGFGASGATPAKQGGFGSSFGFGTPAATSAAPTTGFGTFGSSFGTGPMSAPSSGFGFGSTTTTSTAPLTTGFGATPAFGAPGATSGFGATAAPAFGSTNTGFGAQTTSTGFGAPAATGFGATTLGGFGQAAAATSAPLFGGFGTTGAAPTSSFGGFGTGSTFGGSTFGTGTTFNKPAGTTGFGGFGTGTGLGMSTFGQPQPQLQLGQQQQQPQPPPNPNEALANSVLNCSIYGDDRDSILAKWNYLQAAWGVGKGYYSTTAPPVEYTQENPMCRFKAIGYSCMPAHENREGLVVIMFNKKENELKAQQSQLLANFSAVLGNKPNLTVTIDSMKSQSDLKTQVVIFVLEKGVTGSSRRIPATELAAFLLQPMQKQQLGSLGVDNVFPQMPPDHDQLKEYLETPPAGIDPRLWKQAQADNPNPQKYIPVPMVGFGEVKWRMKCQEEETKRHQAFLDKVADDIDDLQRKKTATTAKIAEQHRKYIELQHRVLQVIVKQESTRKAGMSLQPEEELLRSQLEAMQTQISAPTQFKGRLSELLSQIRMQRCQSAGTTKYNNRYTMDPATQAEVKQFLAMQQKGLNELVEVVNQDMDSLKIISEGMTQLLATRGNC